MLRQPIFRSVALIAGLLFLAAPRPGLSQDESKKDRAKGPAEPAQVKPADEVPSVDLLDALRSGKVSVKAEGIGDGRITVSVTNRTEKKLRIVLPPGIIAQGATGQFGGMGGMGGGGMGGMMGGMGGGGMMGGMGGGGMMGGMGGGMGGMGGGMGGMGGGMGRGGGTMPPTMGMMMLARMIMYFCGDPDSWDPRSIMMGMMGGMMGGMGGGMMGGMGGGMGGMGGGMGGGGMRSVPATELPSALLNPHQTRHLPTRLVSLSAPDPQAGTQFPAKGSKVRIVGDVADVNQDIQVQKALRRLTADKAPTTLSQLVMWRIAAGLDWATITELSTSWANSDELTLARSFVENLEKLPEGETGRILMQIDADEEGSRADAAALKKAIDGSTLLGLTTLVMKLPEEPPGPAVACRVRLRTDDAFVQILSSDSLCEKWMPFGKFTLTLARKDGKLDLYRFADGLAEGALTRLVRAQLIKGSGNTQKGKLVYQIKIDNASPLILNGIAVVGTANKGEAQTPQILSMFSVSPRKSLTVPASDEMVRTLGLKKGIKVVALDLSGL
jgi:hypothetical protein